MRNWDCPYECSDDDCYKCAKHGYTFSCEGCPDYEEWIKSIENKKKGDNT